VGILSKLNPKILLFVSVITTILFSSCDRTTIYNESEILENATWPETDTLVAQFLVGDSLHYHNIFVCSRFNALYPESNVYFKVMLKGPGGQHMTEIKSFEITEKSGKWIGKGFGDLHSYELPIFQDLNLKQFGKYEVKVIPYMRRTVIGIHDRGIKVNLGKEIF
jgi:gliding motility-associated lipoprotein GldH